MSPLALLLILVVILVVLLAVLLVDLLPTIGRRPPSRQHEGATPMNDVSTVPEVDVPVNDGRVHLPAVLAKAFAISMSEARRSLNQGGVHLDGEPIEANALDVSRDGIDGKVLQLGKRRFARLRVERDTHGALK